MLKIAHLADIHIRNVERHDEYREIFTNLYQKLREIKPERIVIVGDLFESFIEISNEAKILAGNLLNELSKIAKVIITRGNHDIRKKNLNRTDSIKVIVELINNSNVIYYDNSGIFNDGLINWVVYDHPNKNIDPWSGQTKDNSKIYIGLFHDPIIDCTDDMGRIYKDGKPISYFKDNDFLLLGDIHKRQYFRKNKSGAFVGSTIQQKHNESVDKHGFLIWKINSKNDFEVEEIDIQNEHTFINFYIDQIDDYDKLNLITLERIGSRPEFKIHWKDLSSNINIENERKIRRYIKERYNTNKVKFDKTPIYTDVISSKMLSESLDLTNLEVQRKIFKEYLIEQKYNDIDIEEILKVDDFINDRLELKEQSSNIEWKIDKLWFDNFRTYGDSNVIDWSNVNGIIQIHGLNQQGKTTILDAITYLLYGNTTTTEKREKFGDNRYINNKRDLDSCKVGAVLDINGDKIIIQRKTERKWNRTKSELVSCSTNLDYYNSDIISDENILNEEQRRKTQKQLDLILGDFKDFIRLSLTNADNLNELLSADRSLFIDSIIRDAGYDIFEKKLKEFKDFKKNDSEEKVILDISSSESQISVIEKELDEKRTLIYEKEKHKEEKNKELDKINKQRDRLLLKLNKIDESMSGFDSMIANETISNFKEKISKSTIQIGIYDEEISKLPSKFESTKLNILRDKLKETNEKITTIKEEISGIKKNNVEIDSKIDKVKSKLRELRDSEIKKYKDLENIKQKELSEINGKKQEIINQKIILLKDAIKNIEVSKINLENKIKNFQKDGTFLKTRNNEKLSEIEEIKNSSFCPTCGRDYDEKTPEHLEHIKQKISKLQEEIDNNNQKIRGLIDEFKTSSAQVPILEANLENLKVQKKNLEDGIFDDDIIIKIDEIGSPVELEKEIKNISQILDRLGNNDLSVTESLLENFNKGKMYLKKMEGEKNNNTEVIENLEKEFKLLNIESIEDDISLEEKIKEDFETRKEKISLKENLFLNIDNYKLKIREVEQSIDKYKEYEFQIKENREIQEKIDDIDNLILDIKYELTNDVNNISEINKEIALKEKESEHISKRIEKFVEQRKKEELLKEYQKCISRDGIPTYLLKKSLHLINKELNDLLIDVDFTLFFDDQLNLKLSMDDRLDVTQNAIESSGKERTFSALALKMALRQINVKSRPNFLILDEVMVKLVENSIDEFMLLLETMKTKIDKIIIIEHLHNLDFNMMIEVKKDENLVSSFTIEI